MDGDSEPETGWGRALVWPKTIPATETSHKMTIQGHAALLGSGPVYSTGPLTFPCGHFASTQPTLFLLERPQPLRVATVFILPSMPEPWVSPGILYVLSWLHINCLQVSLSHFSAILSALPPASLPARRSQLSPPISTVVSAVHSPPCC